MYTAHLIPDALQLLGLCRRSGLQCSATAAISQQLSTDSSSLHFNLVYLVELLA